MSSFCCDYGDNIEIGEIFADHYIIILDKVIFGDNVFTAPNCRTYIAGHPIDFKRRNQGVPY